MTKSVHITKRTVHNHSGSYVVNYDATVIDELENRKNVRGSFAVTAEDSIPGSLRADLVRKLGYQGFVIADGVGQPGKRPTLGVAR